jgi:hypothetical protein
MTVRKVRRSQIVSPFGPGALIDLVGESFVVEDAGRWRWRGRPEEVDFPRLAAYLKVPSLRAPSARLPLPYYRFPCWLFCSHCRRMVHWATSQERLNEAPKCQVCPGSKQLIPMRFVAVCANGHLTDVQWKRWAHSSPRGDRNQTQCAANDLRFLNKSGVGGGLQSLVVQCKACGSNRSLEGLTTRIALRQLRVQCTGRQPWQSQQDAELCAEPMVAMQRGASSVYFPNVESAIDIPPDSSWSATSDSSNRLLHRGEFRLLMERPDHPLRAAMIGLIASEAQLTADEVETALTKEISDPYADLEGGPENIPSDEWGALVTPQQDHDHRDRFITRRSDRPLREDSPATGMWNGLLTDVVLVDRLREVRVLTHFNRHTMEQDVKSNLAVEADFLPAIEVFGEGFFLRFDEGALAAWESRVEVVKRCAKLVHRAEQSGLRRLSTPTPRFVLLHTFAHLLLRNTAFEAGYSTSSLRERLYVTDAQKQPPMAGILIYTAAGDSEGTLGGLVRMGEFPRLSRLLDTSIAAAQWCSFDPVCGESPGQGPSGLSLAACHACSLVPETSCVETNRLLDRKLLVDPDYGFFAGVANVLDRLPGGTW